MHQNIIDEIVQLYDKNGYVSEDIVFDALIANDIPLDQVDYICETLLSMGVIIKNDTVSDSDVDFVIDRSQLDFEEIYEQIIEIDESLAWLIDKVRLITPPQNREWMTLIPQAQNGNRYAYERLVDMYLRLVIKMALSHHQRFGISLDDAIQDGIIGLITAIEKFEMGKQDNFGQYAPWWIRQHIMREAEPPTSFMRYPVHYKDKMFVAQEMIIKNKNNTDYLYDKKILISDLAGKVECNEILAVELLDNLCPSLSIEELVRNNPDVLTDLGSQMSDVFDNLEHQFLNKKINKELFKMKQRERQVIELRFAFNRPESDIKTLEEVGEIFGVTRERIRQIEAKALRKLKNSLSART